ncbi:MAG: hypothetical protein M3373_13850 [Gemmatimonadota bacterium]|nr:hypothetical protein [Gemmatimonadota bacterium]
MRRDTPFVRTLWLLCALLQLSLPGLASWAEARIAAASGAAVAHVEDRTSESCVPVHPADCALCRYVGSREAPPPESASSPARVACAQAPAASADTPDRLAALALLRPRAPPLLS